MKKEENKNSSIAEQELDNAVVNDKPEELSDYEFMREKIKERPINRRRLTRRMVITAGMAVLFGLIACLTIILLEPVLGKLVNPGNEMELQEVRLPEVVTDEEPLDEDVVILPYEETPIQDMNLIDPEDVSGNSASANRVPSSDTPVLELEDYQTLHRKMYNLSAEVSNSMVTVTGISEDMDFGGDSQFSIQGTPGLIIADNGVELLILADTERLTDAESIRVTFCDGEAETAVLKQSDADTGLGIYGVTLSDIATSTKETYTLATLGSSYTTTLPGSSVIAVGDPMNTGSSVCYGSITSVEGRVTYADASYQLLMTDIYGSQEGTGILINLKGHVIGFISQRHNAEGLENLIHAYGISSIRSLIEDMSNEEARSYLGLFLTDVTKEAMDFVGIPQGAYVTKVDLESPAMSYGIMVGDVIVKINEREILDVNDYIQVINELSPGDMVTITYERLSGESYKEVTVSIPLEEKE